VLFAVIVQGGSIGGLVRRLAERNQKAEPGAV